MSAYALNRAVRAHAPLYRPLKQGNVYHSIAKLESQALFIVKAAKSERGPQDSKSVYCLSAAGEKRFHGLLLCILSDVQAPDPAIEIAYVLLAQLPRERARALLADRLKAVTDQEKRLGRLFGEAEDRNGGGHLALLHTSSGLQDEQRFLREAMKLLQNKRWHPEWSFDANPIAKPS